MSGWPSSYQLLSGTKHTKAGVAVIYFCPLGGIQRVLQIDHCDGLVTLKISFVNSVLIARVVSAAL